VSDRIIVKGLQVFARHGVLEEEKRLGQRFAVDIVAHLDLKPAGESDDYAKAVGYDAIVAIVTKTLTATRYNLIEAVAEAVAQAVLARFPAIEKVEVELRKPAAPINAVFASVGVRIERARGA
jgi:7,8-dihydroneopterin aldolase/epimerase/oxygenase